MATDKKLFPIGIQSFEKLRSDNYLYADKTPLIYQMTHNYQYVFLSRPRRFGKSLLTSTLHCYFTARKELFKGLAMEQLETEWTEYPVLHFDMSIAKQGTIENLKSNLNYMLSSCEKEYGIEKKDEDCGLRLKNLIEECAKKYNKNVVVLIDEYDAPLLDVIVDEERLNAVRIFMRNFYAPLKNCDPYLRFVFITGITKFSQLSIFSELNNLKNISMMPEYSAICGISQSEIETQMTDEVKAMGQTLELTYEQTLAQLKSNYDGYHFSYQSEDIYNPFSLINALSDKMFNSYWFSTGTPTFLINLLKKYDTDLTSIDGSETEAADFDAPTEGMVSVLPILYQSGYLTIRHYDRSTALYTLGFPNREVRYGLMHSLMPYFLAPGTEAIGGKAGKMSRSLKQKDLDGFLTQLQDFMAAIPYTLDNKTEKHYQTILYVVLNMLTRFIDVEVCTATGRIDAVLETDTTLYVMELKLDKSPEEALAQIESKNYLIPYQQDGRQLVRVGINFSSQTRTIDGWIAK